ncbi:MAG: hypothetical protein JEZ08_24245 [Clostridiales bacterium]|nr:hypothetical protein [Clostridiales bacterium]
MKKIIMVLLILLLVGCQKTETNPNEYSAYMMNIKDGVTAFSQEIYDMNSGEKTYFEVFEMGYYSSSNYSCKFDEKGNPKEIIEKTPDGEPVVSWLSEFDNNNRIKVFTAVFAGMDDYNETVYNLDSEGQVIVTNQIIQGTSSQKNGDEILSETKVATTFDEHNRAIKISNDVEIEGLEGHPLYEYNDKGYVSDVYWYDSGEKICHVMIKYNVENYMASYRYIINPMNDMKLLEFDYIYDEHNNWIEQKITVDGEDMYVVKRTYQYADK